jgi:hypothetical protein
VHAEQALALKETMHPAAAEVWTTYAILADIADRQGEADAARDYRRKERASYAAAPVSRHELQRWLPEIAAVVQTAAEPAARAELDSVLAQLAANGWTNLVDPMRRILAGERDEDALCTSLDRDDWLIVATILRAIADPATLPDLAPPQNP